MADAKSVFGSLKSKLGFGGNQSDGNYDHYEDYEEYDEYDEYNDYDEYDEYDDYVDDRISTRETAYSSSLPRLVSREDARQSTRSSRSTGSSSRRNGRTMVDSSLPDSMTPEGTAHASALGNSKAHGLDSLFGSRSERSKASDSSSISTPSFTGRRNLQVIKPSKYDDAEGITRALKLGNAAILVLTDTTDVLSRRILDFGFGATSALNGTVEGLAPKIYAFTTQAGLSDQEKSELQNLGVIK